jgi:hypothetical protein
MEELELVHNTAEALVPEILEKSNCTTMYKVGFTLFAQQNMKSLVILIFYDHMMPSLQPHFNPSVSQRGSKGKSTYKMNQNATSREQNTISELPRIKRARVDSDSDQHHVPHHAPKVKSCIECRQQKVRHFFSS